MGYLDTMNVFARLRHWGELRNRYRRSHGFRAAGRDPSQRGVKTTLQPSVEHGVTGFVVNSPDEYAQAVRSCCPTPRKPSN